MQADIQELAAHSKGLSDNNKKNIQNTCRLCMLMGSTRMEPIFQLYIRSNCESSIAEKIASVTQLNPREGDGLPPVVCQQCIFQLDVADAFIQRCKQSDTSLRSLLMQEGARDEGTERSSKPNSQPVTSIPAPLASGACFTATDKLPETGTISKDKSPTKKGSPECKLIPPALSSKLHTLPEHAALTEISAEVSSKVDSSTNIKPVDNVKARKDGSRSIKNKTKQRKSRRSKASKCPCYLISYTDKHSLTRQIRTQEDTTNRSSTNLLQPAIDTSTETSQPLLANAEPTVPDPKPAETETKSTDTPVVQLSESERVTHRALPISTQLRVERLMMKARQDCQTRRCKCAVCGLVMDVGGRVGEPRHLCLTYVTDPVDSAGRPPSRVKLMHSLQQGQLQQLHWVPKVVLERIVFPEASCTNEVTEPVEIVSTTNVVEQESVPTPSVETSEKVAPESQPGSDQPFGSNYLKKRKQTQLLHEMVELGQMKQRLKARLGLVDLGEEGVVPSTQQVQTVKLTLLKRKLQAKLQQETVVVCSPDVSLQLAIAESEPFDAFSSLPVKVEPWAEDEAFVDTAPTGSKRQLQAEPSSTQDVSEKSPVDGFLGHVKVEPKSEEDDSELRVGEANYRNGIHSKKARLKLSR